MNSRNCDICRGAGVIRLPAYRPLAVASFKDVVPSTVTTTIREFPCPQCSGATDSTHVLTLGSLCEIDERCVGLPGVREMERHNLAAQLAEQLVASGLVAFTERPHPEKMTVEVRAEVGVVSRAFVASMEKRVAQRQWELARETIEAAGQDILDWNRQYTGADGHISKRKAAELLAESLTRIQMTRAKEFTR